MADNETLFQNYLWRVEIDGFAIAEYNECAEIKTTTEVIERKPGGSHWTKKEAGRSKAENITLRRDLGTNKEMKEWRDKVVNAKTLKGLPPESYKKDIDVVQLDRELNPIKRWRLVNAWPSEYAAGPWNGDGNAIVQETVTITYDRPTDENP